MRTSDMAGKNPNNLKTALWLAALALLFFVGVFVRQLWLR